MEGGARRIGEARAPPLEAHVVQGNHLRPRVDAQQSLRLLARQQAVELNEEAAASAAWENTTCVMRGLPGPALECARV